VIRVAAVGDVHVGPDSTCPLGAEPERIAEDADLLLLAGDLTRVGAVDEAEALVAALECIRGFPVVGVLGNHDLASDAGDEITKVMTAAGVTMLEGESTVVIVGDATVGIAGTRGFGGGFPGACAAEFGEPEMRAFVHFSKRLAASLTSSLEELETDVRIALTHYAPIEDTLEGERLEIYPFLGSYLLAEAVDTARADLAVHGHAHHGTERGVTPGGTAVRNVAQPVLRRPYGLYCLEPVSTPVP
jgi:Icc-related predicted phosphoesterase